MTAFQSRLTGGLAAVLVAGALLYLSTGPATASSRWGANYFPNVPLVTQDGETVHFYDDLLKDKVVALNFIFTSCTEVCPAETARLREVQRILGDRVGQDVFMYSITIDPETDTPEVLAEYREKFNVAPGWTFLTGKEEDITLLRKKLGLFIEELSDDPNDHNISLIVGNETTGRWMKRSPFDNPKVLATVIGEWLHNWTRPTRGDKQSYAEAGELPKLTRGEYLWRTRCNTCHTIGGGDGVGPDLLHVTRKRDPAWLARWLREPDVMLKEGDPLAVELYERHSQVSMPNLGLTELEVSGLIEYIDAESERVDEQRADALRAENTREHTQH